MNKAEASRDAGYASPSVFDRPAVKAAVAEQITVRAERLRVGGDWVLSELKRVYDRCMQTENILDREGVTTGEIRFDAANALKALALIGKHTDVRAFEDTSAAPTDDDIIARLKRGRDRALENQPPQPDNKQKGEISFF